MKKFIFYLYIFLSLYLTQTNTSIATFTTKHDLDQLDAMTRDIQQLHSKVELLEHELKQLQIIINNNKSSNHDQNTNNGDISSTSNEERENNKELNSNSNSKEVSKNKFNTTGSDKQDYDLALNALKNNSNTEANERFEDFVKRYTSSPLLGNALFWYGETFSREKLHEKAALYYLKSYKTAPKGAKAADALLKLAGSLQELKKTKDACGMLNKLENEFPNLAASTKKRADEIRNKLLCK